MINITLTGCPCLMTQDRKITTVLGDVRSAMSQPLSSTRSSFLPPRIPPAHPTAHPSPLTPHQAPLAAHHSPLTLHHPSVDGAAPAQQSTAALPRLDGRRQGAGPSKAVPTARGAAARQQQEVGRQDDRNDWGDATVGCRQRRPGGMAVRARPPWIFSLCRLLSRCAAYSTAAHSIEADPLRIHHEHGTVCSIFHAILVVTIRAPSPTCSSTMPRTARRACGSS